MGAIEHNSKLSRSEGRRGAAVLELLIALPVLIIGSMAAVEMGLWMSGRERLEMAARIGAEEAAESLNFERVQRRIKSYLRNAKVPTDQLEILLIHNVGSGGLLSSSQDATWNDVREQLPPAPITDHVRVVVRLPSGQLAPNLLKSLGFDLNEHWSVRAKTLRYEGN